MKELKHYLLDEISNLNIRMNYRISRSLEDDMKRVVDRARYETLKEVVRNAPEIDSEEFENELVERIRKTTEGQLYEYIKKD